MRLTLTGIALSRLVDTRFQGLFTPLAGVLFAFPSRYLFTIGRQVVFSLGRWSSRIPTGFPVSRGTWVPYPGIPIPFHLQDYHLLWRSFPTPSTMEMKSPRDLCESLRYEPVPSRIQRSQASTYTEFRLFPFRS